MTLIAVLNINQSAYEPKIWTEKADAEKEHGQVAKEHNKPDSEKNYEAVFS